MRSGVSVRFGISTDPGESALYNVRAGDVCKKKTESGNCQQLRLFFGILSLEKAFEPGFGSEITITDLLKAKMAAH